MMLRLGFLLLPLLGLPACSYQLRVAQQPTTSLFIAIPINDKAVEPVGQLVYEQLIDHFAQCGYALVDSPKRGYTLKTIVQHYRPKQHFISQDVVLMNKLVEIQLVCGLYNYNDKLVAEKTFTFETIISKAQLPLQQDAYTTHGLRAMLEHQKHIIEQSFRRYLR